MNILIFKNDRVGDILHHSSIIYNIRQNFKDSNIILVCSRYNYSIAKNYKFIDEIIISDGQNTISFYLKHIKILKKKFDYVFILDGKNSSILTSLFVRSQNRVTVCYKKVKKIFGIKINNFRPSNFILKFFFKYFIYCDENYYNTSIIYQKIYIDLLEKCNLKIFEKKNIYILQDNQKNNYRYIKEKINLNEKFCLFHLDEKMNQLNKNEIDAVDNLINDIFKKKKIILTTGIFDFKYTSYFKKKYKSINFNNLNNSQLNIKNEIIMIEKLPVDLLAYFLKDSDINISFHAGPIVNISAALNKKIVDIMPKHKFNELGRWIPIISNYKRYSIENINKILNDI